MHARGARSRVLRIIGGEWRGRRLRFASSGALRPTPDRVRETLFNWLDGRLVGARCLDLFAGSGALGLEALSRGAARVLFIEQHAAAARALNQLLAEWGGVHGAVRRADALRFLKGAVEPFDIVFLDPPFASDLLVAASGLLEDRGWLAPHALIYLECAARAGLPALPAHWRVVKAKRAGEVGYHLIERASDSGET